MLDSRAQKQKLDIGNDFLVNAPDFLERNVPRQRLEATMMTTSSHTSKKEVTTDMTKLFVR